MTRTARGDAGDVQRCPEQPRTTLEREALAMLSDSMALEVPGEDLLAQACRLLVEGSDVAGACISCPHTDGTVTLSGAHPAGLGELVKQQFTLRDGPCFDSWSTGAPVVVYRLDAAAAARWPLWGARALGQLPAGVSALRSDPVKAGGGASASVAVMGTARAVRAMNTATVRGLAQAAVTHALMARSHGHYKTLAGQLQRALDSRVRIEQAKGALARHYGISVDTAFERLRWLARDQGRRLHEVAEEIVAQLAHAVLLPDDVSFDGRAAARPPLRVVRVPDGVRLLGAADVSAVPVLTTALGQLDGLDPVVVDLGKLAFLDAQCARILLACAGDGPGGRRLVLKDPRPVVEQVLALLGANDQPGVRLLTDTGR